MDKQEYLKVCRTLLASPTTNLRWWKPVQAGSEARLQQMYMLPGNSREWRDIPVVCEWEENAKRKKRDETK